MMLVNCNSVILWEDLVCKTWISLIMLEHLLQMFFKDSKPGEFFHFNRHMTEITVVGCCFLVALRPSSMQSVS